jgi:hypothetical protein
MAMVPATTPEQIDAVLRLLSGRHELTRREKRFGAILSLSVGTIVCGIFIFGAWLSHWNPFLIACAAVILSAAAYDLLKLHRVIEIGPSSIEHRMPLGFLCWRIQTSELRVIDVELGEKQDVLRLATKTGGKRRLPIPAASGARLRA